MSRPTTPAAPPAYVGVFDLFQVGIGPSSSHTVGPMRAAADFVADLGADAARVGSVEVTLYGSLAATGRGHGTLEAVLVGLEGARPETVRPAELRERIDGITAEHRVQLPGGPAIALGVDDITLEPRTILARHTNGMRLIARDGDGAVISEALYFSVGGGTVVREDPAAGLSAEVDLSAVDPQPAPADAVAYPFTSADELLEICTREGISIAEVVIANETANRSAAEVHAGLREIWEAMDECISAGVAATGVLPGGLKVPRRAPELHRRLLAEDPDRLPEHAQEWVNLVALAVNEENAGGGRVVTAPTNGAAGIIPAVLHYARWYTPAGRDGAQDEIVATFLLTAAAIGTLFKTRASISGAEVGCQGEVGSASSMAAGGLAAVLGGTPAQVENAAEIAMEHHLGLTCDPVGGLVQIPCIERNAIAAGTAINAVRIAMRGDGSHLVSLDAVIETMRQTGHDMNDRYKETAQGGLAVNVVEC